MKKRGGILRTSTETDPQLPRTSRRVSWADRTVEVRPWGYVFDNVLVRVLSFLGCRSSRVRMACVNRHWHAAVTGPRPPGLPPLPPLPLQLPWLIFPNNEAPTFYTPLTRRYHRLFHLPPDVRYARFCGSGDGGWLVLALTCNAHALYNLNTGRRIPLPHGFTSPSDEEFPLIMRTATLSAAPSPDPYMVAAIVLVGNRSAAAFWSEGSESWFTSGPLLTVRPQDVIFYQGAFYFVTSNEGVISFRPAYGPNGDVHIQRVDYSMEQRADYINDTCFIGGMGMMKRYLVASRGHLLMVVRYLYGNVGLGDMTTSVFRVFGFRVVAPAANGQSPRATWEDMGSDLDGRMLFLGAGCSRSFEVAQYDGFQDLESTIFFLDDRLVSVTSADGRKLYSFADIGMYDMDEMSTEAWPRGRRPTRSNNAPPTWWLH